MIYILVTGTRKIRDLAKADVLVRSLLGDVVDAQGAENITVIHGAAEGIDTLFDLICNELGIKTEDYPAHLFNHPFARNEFMVKLVADLGKQGNETVCWAFASKWASGTGHCARKARLHGLRVVDYGVSTDDPNAPF